jgi:3-oxoisoapionate kinase
MNLLLAYYGDDFTGSTDVMEALQWAGLRTVLFLAPPTPAQLARFENLRAFGVAGWSRTMSPAEMDRELKPVLEQLKASGATFVHYKVCSTFDSAPGIGSIGRAVELGREVFGVQRPVPILVGAPVLGRYTIFGHLFARSGLDSEPFRLDRHPTMARHPITPMDESDVRIHLSRQTRLSMQLFDVLQLNDDDPEERFEEFLGRRPEAVLFDVLYPSHLATIGRLIDSLTVPAGFDGEPEQIFVVGSSGIEYALTDHWNETGYLDELQSHRPGKPSFGPVDQLLVLTGSCSPVNDDQISWALSHGFVEVPLHPARLINPKTRAAELESAIRRGLELADQGANVLLHSSRGPGDRRVMETLRELTALGFDDSDLKLRNSRTLGPLLGRVLKGILEGRRFARVGVAGGDTSGFVARELGVEALEALAPVAPGSPLCRVHAANAFDGLEIICKGGQVGKTDVWGILRKGTA